jgi:prepilin-type N-terminal cleavage/methylation domain-containing protein
MERRLSHRRGYTLLEMALVTALLSVVAALAYPSIEGMYGRYKVTAGVDAVRAAWAQGRSRAIAEARPYRFAIMPGQAQFRLAPDQPEFWGGSAAGAPGLVVEGALPKGVNFGASSGQGDGSGAWNTLAVFLPDGSARDDAELEFHLRGAAHKVLQLRALTGAVTTRSATGG